MNTLPAFAKTGRLEHLLRLQFASSFLRCSSTLKTVSAPNPPGYYVEALSYRIHVETVGTGPHPVVLLPGAIALVSSLQWKGRRGVACEPNPKNNVSRLARPHIICPFENRCSRLQYLSTQLAEFTSLRAEVDTMKKAAQRLRMKKQTSRDPFEILQSYKSIPVLPHEPGKYSYQMHYFLERSTRTDFTPQLEKLDRKLFTINAWDPPGYGFSRPPERSFPVDFYHRDARVLAEVMHKLGHKQYSIVGWSDGANTGMILAAIRPDSVQKLVAFGGNAYITEQDVQLLEATRDIEKWSEKMRASMEALYGTECFRHLWSSYCDFYHDVLHKHQGEVCRNELPRIRCPTLIVHGGRDPLVPSHHPHYLLQHIANAKLYMVPDGKHNLHFKYADEFNKIVTEFLIS